LGAVEEKFRVFSVGIDQDWLNGLTEPLYCAYAQGENNGKLTIDTHLMTFLDRQEAGLNKVKSFMPQAAPKLICQKSI